ncbi:unnamed protein product [Enterobius vermicularis]|uniref:Zinc/iron permease n=1 Tax=Enterobius vermicularis TaxID=51028 RepID=A0A0N4VCL9_ENTVE|nr:unnamed protein product [Enterobius vermicularis]
MMIFLVALGIGALSGSIMFIMLPQAFGVSSLKSSDYLLKSWIVLGALYGFFAVDRILQCVIEAKRRVKWHLRRDKIDCGAAKYNPYCSENVIFNAEHSRELEHEIDEIQLSSRRRVPFVITPNETNNNHSQTFELSTIDAIYPPKSHNTLQVPQMEIQEDRISVSVSVVEKIEVPQNKVGVASVAYMIIIGSAANNFVDAMSNGVAFADSLVRGLSIGIACIAQQFPQEVGTLAILARSGLGLKKTLLLSLIPATLSYIGFAVGAVAEDLSESADKIVFSVSSGMYLYIFLGTLIPEVRESFNEIVKGDVIESIVTTVLQASGVLIGVCFLYVMAVYGKDINL